VIAPSPAESFSARWAPESELEGETARPGRVKKPEASKGSWKVLVKDSLTIEPESVAMVNAIVKGISSNDAMYFDVIPLNRGPNAFVSASSGIVLIDDAGCFRVKLANAAERRISVKSGELLGHLSIARDSLESSANLSEAERALFYNQASLLAVLVPSLDARPEKNLFTLETPGIVSEDSESAGWGPKTTEPAPDQIYSLDKL